MAIAFDYIDTNQKLAKVVDYYLKQDHFCFDTEFIAQYTFYPKLGLIQICANSKTVIIDPLPITDMQPLQTLFSTPNIVKVAHCAKEDVRILQKYLKIVIPNLWDSQIANTYLKQDQFISYSKLVANYLNITIEKESQVSDWLERPLANKLLQYAAADVYYLEKIYKVQRQQFLNHYQDKLPWLLEDSLQFNNSNPIEKEVYQVNHNQFASGAQKQLQLYIRKYRLKRAMQRNRVSSIVLNDAQIGILIKAFKVRQLNINFLKASGQFSNNWLSKYATECLAVLKKYKQPSTIPKSLKTRKEIDQLVLTANAIIKQIAKNHQLPPFLIATKRDLYAYFYYFYGDLPQLEKTKLQLGWRDKILSQTLKQLGA